MSASDKNDGVLLVGHGTRDPAGMAEFRVLAAKIGTAVAPRAVEAGFIELVEPTIAMAFDRLVERGCSRIRVVPLLLFAAGHAKSDVPAALHDAAARHEGIQWDIADPLSLDDPIVSLSRRRFDEALIDRQPLPPDEMYWLLVGRGSSDLQAAEAMERFALRRAEQSSLVKFGCCFVAAAKPTLDEGLQMSTMSGVKRIVVQPHLLIQGFVVDEVHAAVKRWQARLPEIDWVMTAHLGAEQELVAAVAARVLD